MHYLDLRTRKVAALGVAITLSLIISGPASADTDHYLGYQAQESNKLDALGKNCNVIINDAAFGEKENLNVSKTKAFYLPTMKNNEAIQDPNGHLIGFQVKASKLGIGDPIGKCAKTAPQNASTECTTHEFCGGDPNTPLCEKTKFPKGAKHLKKGAKTGDAITLINQFGAITLETSKRELLLVPSAKSLTGPAPDPLGGDSQVDHYLCYKAKEAKIPVTVSGVEPQQDEKGKLRKGLQALLGNQFNDGAGHPDFGNKILYDLKKVTKVCNPVAKANIDTQTVATSKGETRTTDCVVAGTAAIQTGPSLVCYQAKATSKALGVCSQDSGINCKADKDCGTGNTCDLLPFPHVPTNPHFPASLPGRKIDPKQAKHVPHSAKTGNPLFITHQFGAPTNVDTKKETEFCVPTIEDSGFCGDNIVQPEAGEMCDAPGSPCGNGQTCSSQCLCPIDMGTHASVLQDEKQCKGGDRDGLPCNVGADCPNADPQFPCRNTASFFELNFKPFGLVSPLRVPFPLLGETTITCGAVDPNTGTAPCSCALVEIEEVPLTGIGDICFGVGDPNNCPMGLGDCDGGASLDHDLVATHNAGSCLDLNGDPNHFACEDKCDTYCPSFVGPGYVQHQSQCEGACVGGNDHGQLCNFDSDCDGSCAGGDPVQHANTCNCICIKDKQGAPSRPGAISCQTAANIVVEPLDPTKACGVLAASIILGDTCIPYTTETSTSSFRWFNENGTQPDPNLILPFPEGDLVTAVPDIGVPGTCEAFSTSVTSGSRLVGTIMFFDSDQGDLLVPQRLVGK